VTFLTKNGKLVTKGGKLVTTNNPAACDCCGPPSATCDSLLPVSMDIDLTATCFTGLISVPLQQNAPGSYVGENLALGTSSSAYDCVNGLWDSEHFINTFNPATGGCNYIVGRRLACNTEWSGQISPDGARAKITLRCSPPPKTSNPLP
jgi:hypothetical protein